MSAIVWRTGPVETTPVTWPGWFSADRARADEVGNRDGAEDDGGRPSGEEDRLEGLGRQRDDQVRLLGDEIAGDALDLGDVVVGDPDGDRDVASVAEAGFGEGLEDAPPDLASRRRVHRLEDADGVGLRERRRGRAVRPAVRQAGVRTSPAASRAKDSVALFMPDPLILEQVPAPDKTPGDAGPRGEVRSRPGTARARCCRRSRRPRPSVPPIAPASGAGRRQAGRRPLRSSGRGARGPGPGPGRSGPPGRLRSRRPGPGRGGR